MTRRWSGAMGSRRSSRPRMASTSFRCAKAPTPATATASTGCTSGISRGPRPCCPPAASPASRCRCAGSATRRARSRRPSSCRPTFEREFRHSAPGRQGLLALSQRVSADDARQRARERAQRRPGARHAVSGPDGAQRRDREAGRRRPVRLQGDQGPGLRHSLLRPADPVAARLGDVSRQERRRRDARVPTTRSAPTASSAFRPPKTPNTSSG